MIDFTGSSPLTRGKPGAWRRTPRLPRLIPAHAGKTGRAPRTLTRSSAHPRSRGENKRSDHTDPGASGSSPLTRGKPYGLDNSYEVTRLIPAHAGKTREMLPCPPSSRAHPRSRGENDDGNAAVMTVRGSSPLTRGKRLPVRVVPHVVRLIPAHAGKTPGGC